MRETIAAPTEYHADRLKKTEPFVGSDGTVFAAQIFSRHFYRDPEGERKPTTLIVPYLKKTNVPPAHIAQVFTPESIVIPASEEEFDITRESVETIVAYFRGTAERAMRLINPSLRGPRNRYIINNHDLPHALTVTNSMLSLLRDDAIETSEQDRKVAGMAGMLHDIGNVVGRDDHPCHGVHLARHLYPNVRMGDRQAMLFDHTVLLHDGDDIYNVLKGWGPIHADVAVANLAKFGPVALSLIVADKASDVGKSRLPQGKRIPKRDYQNVHRIINAFWETDFVGFVDDHETLEMRFAFGKTITPEEAALIPHFVKEVDGNLEIRTAKSVVDTKRTTEPKSQYQHLLEGYWSAYYPRMMLAVMAGFAMNPFLQRARIVMYDSEMRDSRNLNRDLYVFSRDTLARDMWKVWNDMVPPEKKEERAFKQFANFALIERVAA